MGLFDRKKLEKEKINLQTSLDEKIPDYLITSRFLKLFPDVVKRVDILRDLINLNFSKEQYKKFLDCYDNDSELAEFLLVFYSKCNAIFPFEKDFISRYDRNIIIQYPEKLVTILGDEQFLPFVSEVNQLLESSQKENVAIQLFNYSNSTILESLKIIQSRPDFIGIVTKYMDELPQILDVYEKTKIQETFFQKLLELSKDEGKKYIDDVYFMKNEMHSKPDVMIVENCVFSKENLFSSFVSTNDSSLKNFIDGIYTKKEAHRYYSIYNDSEFLEKHNDVVKKLIFEKLKTAVASKNGIAVEHLAFAYYFNIFDNVLNYKSIMKDMLESQKEFSDDFKNLLDFYKSIINQNDFYIDINKVQELIEKTSNPSFSFSQQEIKNEFVKFRNREYSESLLDPNSLVPSDQVSIRYEPYISKEDGKEYQIKIVTLHNLPFESIVHKVNNKEDSWGTASAKFSKQLIETPSLWHNESHNGTNYISMSFNTDSYFHCFSNGQPNSVTLGFSNFGEQQIKMTNFSDNGTSMTEGTEVEQTVTLNSKWELVRSHLTKFRWSDNLVTGFKYNELVSERENVLPDYCVVTDQNSRTECSLLNENTKEWAAHFGIPIVEIDCKSYYEAGIIEYQNALQYLKSQTTIPTFEEIVQLTNIKRKAENFSPVDITDGYSLIMDSINLDNKEWNLENAARLDFIIKNTFDSTEGELLFKDICVLNGNLTDDERQQIINERKQTVNGLRQMVSSYLQMQQDDLGTVQR